MISTELDPASTSARPVRVMHLLHTVAYGGVETNILNWLRRLDRTRFQAFLVVFENPGGGGSERPFVEMAERFGFSVATVPWSRRKPIFAAARALEKLVLENDIDILHTHNTYADCVGAIVKRRTGIRAVTTLYVWADLGWKRNLLQRINRFAIRDFDRITAHCEETHRRSLDLGIPPEKLDTLICGFEPVPVDVSPEARRASRRAMGVEDGHVLLAYVARFYPEKAHDRLLGNFARIHERAPHARLWMVGVGPLEDRLRRRCAELGLDRVVQFMGFFDDLPRKLQLVDIQVHPSDMEGVALAICTGMAVGLPLVCTAVGGVPEVIHDGTTGRLVPHGDDDAFVETVLELVEDESTRAALGHGARRFIENDYSLDKAVRDVERTYLEMMGGA